MWWLCSFLNNLSIIQCGINFVVFSLQPRQFDTKITSEKKSYLAEGWLYIDRLKVESVPEMINKKMLAQFLHIPATCII